MQSKSTHTPGPWLWPDHAIGKRESRQLREEHNALANSHAELLAACKGLLQHCVTPGGMPDKGKGRTPEQQAAFDDTRAAIARAEGGAA